MTLTTISGDGVLSGLLRAVPSGKPVHRRGSLTPDATGLQRMGVLVGRRVQPRCLLPSHPLTQPGSWGGGTFIHKSCSHQAPRNTISSLAHCEQSPYQTLLHLHVLGMPSATCQGLDSYMYLYYCQTISQKRQLELKGAGYLSQAKVLESDKPGCELQAHRAGAMMNARH